MTLLRLLDDAAPVLDSNFRSSVVGDAQCCLNTERIAKCLLTLRELSLGNKRGSRCETESSEPWQIFLRSTVNPPVKPCQMLRWLGCVALEVQGSKGTEKCKYCIGIKQIQALASEFRGTP